MTDKADVREEPVKRGKGRPKLQEGEKGQYNVSRRVKARRAAQKTVTQSKRTAEKHTNKAQAAKNRAKRAENRLNKVESAIYTQNGAKVLEEDVLNN